MLHSEQSLFYPLRIAVDLVLVRVEDTVCIVPVEFGRKFFQFSIEKIRKTPKATRWELSSQIQSL